MKQQPALMEPWGLERIQPVPKFVKMSQEQLTEAIQLFYNFEFGDMDPKGGTCLHWAYITCTILRMAGKRALLQAGSMNWPITRNPQLPYTHFSYEWDPTGPQSAQRIQAGALPEVHVWCALPETGDIIDFSTGDFKQLAEGLHGLKWDLEDPPAYLWCHCTKLPEFVQYRAQYEAIKYVLEHLNRINA